MGQIFAQCGFSKTYITIVNTTCLIFKEPNRLLEFASIRLLTPGLPGMAMTNNVPAATQTPVSATRKP